jgi:YgiT-type zinc finger domain-containing protein
MPACPNCGKLINYLIKRYTQIWETYYNGQNFLTEELLAYACPNCGWVLFEGFPDSELEATKWLVE